MKWKDLTLFGNNFKYKISSTTYSNYPELRKVITRGLKRNKKSEIEWNRKNGFYYGIGFLIFGIIVCLWLTITSKEISDKIIGGIFSLLFVFYGIYLLNKIKKPMPTPYKINCLLFAYLRKSSRIFFVSNYLVNLVHKPRN